MCLALQFRLDQSITVVYPHRLDMHCFEVRIELHCVDALGIEALFATEEVAVHSACFVDPHKPKAAFSIFGCNF